MGSSFSESEKSQYIIIYRFFSDSQDNDDVDDADIVSRLPSPRVHRGIYKFDFDFSSFVVE
jgi:hypothetical protein